MQNYSNRVTIAIYYNTITVSIVQPVVSTQKFFVQLVKAIKKKGTYTTIREIYVASRLSNQNPIFNTILAKNQTCTFNFSLFFLFFAQIKDEFNTNCDSFSRN